MLEALPIAAPPFMRVDIPQRGWLAKLLGLRRAAVGDALLRNLLVERDPRLISSQELADALGAAGTGGSHGKRICVQMWAEALQVFIADDALSDAEVEYLRALRELFGMNAAEIKAVEQAVVHPRFAKSIAATLVDGTLSGAEKDSLGHLQAALRIPDDVAAQELGRIASEVINERLNEAIRDRRYSADERAAIQTLAAALGAKLEYGDAITQSAVERYALLWDLENGMIPDCPCDIRLQRGESCYWTGSVEWAELRTRTVRTVYSGPAARIRIMKGFYWRAGSVSTHRVTKEELTHIDTGQLYLTSKRLVFHGGKANKTIRYSGLTGIEVFSDAVKVEKTSGRSPFLMGTDIELLAAFLSAALARSE
jgi:hypothetical protein